MSTENTFVVFYSNYCNHCKTFLTQLKQLNSNLFQQFTKICVDNNPSVPKAIQSVPTIIVPSHPHPLTDSSVTMWLDTLASQYAQEPVQANQSSHPGNQPQQQHPSQAGPGAAPVDADSGGIMPYVSCEMGSQFSDGFSFLDSDPQSSQPLEHQFSFLSPADGGAPNSMGIVPGQVGGTIDRPSAPQQKANCFDSQYEEYMNTRDSDPVIQRPHQRC